MFDERENVEYFQHNNARQHSSVSNASLKTTTWSRGARQVLTNRNNDAVLRSRLQGQPWTRCAFYNPLLNTAAQTQYHTKIFPNTITLR